MTTEDESDDGREPKQDLRSQVIDWVKTLAGAFVVYLTFTTVAFANYEIPSESMVPHLEVGDRVAVSKFAYGYSRYSLPFNAGLLLPPSQHRLFENLPHRGDVVVFIHPVSGETIIKRAIGLPGDTIEVRDGMLWLNGAKAPTTEPQTLMRLAHPENRREFAQRFEESLPDGYTHSIHNLTDAGRLDNFGPFVVPAGHIFFMGDNRDNSLDSRWPGMGPVPMENLVGRAEIIYFVRPGCGRDPTVACPMQRWMRPLHH
jgi:signal peptidase I